MKHFIIRKVFTLVVLGICLITLHHYVSGTNSLHEKSIEVSAKESSSYPTIKWMSFEIPNQLIQCSRSKICEVINYYENSSEKRQMDAHLFYASELNFFKLPINRDKAKPRRPKDVIWALLHEESPRNKPELLFDEILSLFNYSSTFSRYSDVPLPLHHLKSLDSITNKKYFVETSVKNSYNIELAPILYIQSNCDTDTNRDDYVKDLMRYIHVDSYGACLNNKKMPEELLSNSSYLETMFGDKFLHFVARYKFIISIENGVCNDYVTEKFWRAIEVGVVPIYFGSPTINDWLPNKKSALLIEDFSSPKLLSEHLKRLLDDDKLYEEYLDHKIKMTITNSRLIEELTLRPYQNDFNQIIEQFQCFVCDKLHDKKKEVHIVDRKHYECLSSSPILQRQPSSDKSHEIVMKWWRTEVKKILRYALGSM